MTKEESQIIKGLAIVLMIFLHLFNGYERTVDLSNLIWIDEIPLVHMLARAANPVSFYLFCGGYGLYFVYKRGKDKHHYSRIMKLYIHYWIVLLFFVPLGHYLTNSSTYPGSFLSIIYNVTGFYTTWNGECWFLLPYALISLTSPRLFSIMDRFRVRYVLIFTLFVNLACGYVISRYGNLYLYTNPYLYLPVLYLSLIFPFTLGAMAQKTKLLEWVKGFIPSILKGWWKQIVLVSLLCCLVAARCVVDTSAWGPIYTLLFIIIFLNLKRWKIIDYLLVKLGNMSMEMWLIHSWFCYYLFREEIYSLKYPIVIFVFMLLISYYSAKVVNWIGNKVYKK